MPLRILLLEDTDDDADLILRELRKGGLEFTVQRVETESAYRRQLLEFAPDLILSDYALPQYDGLSALAVAQEICPSTPFIFVSGTMGEETAIEALHHGATDYVLKQRLSRLGSVVRRALREAEIDTKRKQAENAMRKAQGLLAETQALSKLGGWEYDAATQRITWTDEVYRIYGVGPDYDPNDLSRDIGFYAPESVPVLAKAFRQAVEAGESYDLELEFIRANGERLWVRTFGKPIVESGKVVRVSGNIMDITERKQAEDELRLESAALAAAADGIVITDHAGVIEWVNPAFTALTGYSAAEAVGKNPSQLVKSRKQDAAFYRNLWETILAGQVWRGEIINRRKDGSFYIERQTINSVRNKRGEIAHFIAIKQDITENRHFEEQIRAQAALFDLIQDAIVVRDLTGRILSWSKGAETLYGWTAAEVLGQDVAMLIRDTTLVRTCLEQTLKTGQWSGELEKMNKTEKTRIVESRWTLLRDASGLPQSILTVDTDITEKKQVEAQFLRSQRLENVGRLASGIAHDLNNILAPILMAVPMLREELMSEGNQRLLNTMESSALRGASIVKQVLAFGRGIEGQRAPLQLRHLLREMTQIIRETFPKSITLRVLCPHDLWTVNGDSTQLHQVLMNLCVNARDALPTGGALILAAGNVQLDDTFAGKVARLHPGPYVLLTVTDTGTGISPENLERIFEPFFTTKPTDQGTGLGLSTVFGIVKSHGGVVLVASTVGKGTQFSIYLPATDVTPLQLSDSEPGKMPRGNGELILVVDDEESIRAVTVRVLQAQGYRTLVAGDGAKAMILYASHGQEIQLVVTDLMMPTMDGIALVRALRQISPEVKIIVTSGLGSHPQSTEAATLDVDAFLLKPYTITSLLGSVQDALHPREA